MKNDTILVLGDPAPPQLERLQKSLAGETIVAGSSARKFTEAAANASVIFSWSAPLPLLQQVFAMCPNLRWVHSRSVGLEKSLFLELIESPVTLTNGIGVFSPSLGEWVLGAILYFAKDFRRLIRNQQAAVWSEDMQPVGKQHIELVDVALQRSEATCIVVDVVRRAQALARIERNF